MPRIPVHRHYFLITVDTYATGNDGLPVDPEVVSRSLSNETLHTLGNLDYVARAGVGRNSVDTFTTEGISKHD